MACETTLSSAARGSHLDLIGVPQKNIRVYVRGPKVQEVEKDLLQ